MSRWLALDHGLVRIGAAVGAVEGGIATPLEPMSAETPDLPERVALLAGEYQAAGVVVGWPLNDDGTEGEQGRLARAFAADLAEATGLDVRLWDETLSSFEADQRLRGQMTRKQKKRRHDSVAAAAFLEEFLRSDGPVRAVRATQAGEGGGA